MFLIANTPRDYSWGSTTAIAGLLGSTPSGRPEAEVWLGDHPANPARRVDSGQTLIEWASANPERYGHRPLPFLMKILAAEMPLSIQAHPTRDQAARGFARENAAGIDLDAPHRNYRDANHKPEIIIALTEFSALCGFRPHRDLDRVLDALEHVGVAGASALRGAVAEGLDRAVEWTLTRGAGVDELVAALSGPLDDTGDSLVDDALRTAASVSRHFPGDPGIAVSLLLNHVMLAPGEALFLPAGNIHAYLHGLGVEVMATSDNVLRGGLTSKHVDVPELLDVLDFRELDEPRLAPHRVGTVATYTPTIDDFAVTVADVRERADVSIVGPAIALVTDGNVCVQADPEFTVRQGQSVFIEAGETLTELSGTGRIFIAHLPSPHLLNR